jgi:hypothetical protein
MSSRIEKSLFIFYDMIGCERFIHYSLFIMPRRYSQSFYFYFKQINAIEVDFANLFLKNQILLL